MRGLLEVSGLGGGCQNIRTFIENPARARKVSAMRLKREAGYRM
jgi:hypothetical protein